MAIRGGVPALLLLLAAALFLHHAAHAQVTFSRDWTAGKRSSLAAGVGECGSHVKSTVALCQMLVNELRQLTSCEVRAQLLGRDDDVLESAQSFSSPGHSGR